MSHETEIAELVQQIQETNTLLRQRYAGGSSGNTVKIGSTFAQGVFVGLCVATCVATWIALILFAMDIHDLRAWRDIDHAKITKLEARQ